MVGPGGSAVVRCPKCAVEIDLDEDEVDEGEILNCPECEAELEVVQTHPVHLNVISEDDDEDDEEDEEEAEAEGDDGDLSEHTMHNEEYDSEVYAFKPFP